MTRGLSNVKNIYRRHHVSKVVMVAELFVTGKREFQTAGATPIQSIQMLWIGSWSLSPADRMVVDWRISEHELVDDNEACHIDKLIVLFSEFYM